MNYEEQMRREMEAAAAEQQTEPQCPVEEDVDAAFGFREAKKFFKKNSRLARKGGSFRTLKKAGGHKATIHNIGGGKVKGPGTTVDTRKYK